MNYYPFGLTFQQPLPGNLKNRYLYQGQELTQDFGLGVYQFELRNYDAAIGRWWQIDPYDQFHSPYVGMGNNPIIGIDPTGGICPTCPDEAQYDQFRDSEAAFAYNDEVGIYNDMDIMVMGSRDFYNVQVVRASDNLTMGDVMDMQRQLQNVEGLVATFNPENVGMILMMAEGGGTSGGGPKQPVSRLKPRGVNSTQATQLNPYELELTHGLTRSKKQFSLLKDDIRVNGIQESVKFVEHNGKRYVVDGHHRVRAAKELGIKNVPVEQVELPYKGYKTTEDLFYSPY